MSTWSKRRQPTIENWNAPESGVRLARSRTSELIQHYGNNIRSMTIETLVHSAYLQGINDMYDYLEKEAKSNPIPDYQI